MTLSDECRAKLKDLISKTLLTERDDRGLTQDDVAFLTDLTRTCVQNIEYKKTLTDFETFFLLEEAMQLSDDESIDLYMELRAYVREDRRRRREEAGTQHLAERLWNGKRKK